MDSNTAMCAEHEDRAALGVCARCGTYLCAACGYSVNGQVLCIRCNARIPTSSMLTQLRIIAILYFANAALTFLVGVLMLSLPLWIVTADPAGAQDPAAWEGTGLLWAMFGALAAAYVVAAAIQVASGWLMLKRRARPFVIFAIAVTLLVGIMTGLPGLLALGLSVWALIVVLHRDVAAAFDQPRDEAS